ncbi:hypothetical protein [Cyanobium sp. L1E-Cus]|uniref:hypothetical protein n=1 Tax=Cyanobium sp. L1E-Cus TaxID=2823714 RepID=UPI0020CFB114|nr:hypothetical protein [Cyanobium sp. L1E-Cus]MCP9823528.1 hypothetical protein [Cyanobium sp. L1E-Cus]
MLRSWPVAEFRLRGELATAGSRSHPPGASPSSDRALLDAVALIDQQLLAPSPEQEQAIEKQFSSGPIAGSVAAGGDAPLPT